ncbi:hypothetical protein [[Limnothrix rosea] IAM M-220]|uniref:hypothetical protein n=1 Tax=[Limnothrix rosea] IAM M-220 TaxID=454133 RepID=UPI001115738E|nr:hypothetical protein [[Limnothrix rosea] IAM M-220]
MNSKNCSISTCKTCRYFRTEGRRGGTCEQFGTFMDPAWNACPLGVAAFETVPKEVQPIEVLEHSFTLEFAGESMVQALTEPSTCPDVA